MIGGVSACGVEVARALGYKDENAAGNLGVASGNATLRQTPTRIKANVFLFLSSRCETNSEWETNRRGDAPWRWLDERRTRRDQHRVDGSSTGRAG